MTIRQFFARRKLQKLVDANLEYGKGYKKRREAAKLGWARRAALETGSREPSQISVCLGPSGFDPARGDA